MSHFSRSLDEVDAAVFSSDALESLDNRKELKAMCERWLRAIESHELSLKGDMSLEHRDDQAWDHEAEQLTAAALGTNQGVINPHATSVDDIFFEPCCKCKNPPRCAQRGSCIDRDASAPAMPNQSR